MALLLSSSSCRGNTPTAGYAYLFLKNGLLKKNSKFKLFNVYSGELWELNVGTPEQQHALVQVRSLSNPYLVPI